MDRALWCQIKVAMWGESATVGYLLHTWGDEMRIGVHSGAFLAPQSDVVRGPYTLYTELQNTFDSIVSCYIVLANRFNSTVIT